ncbi:MAG: alpha/beta fold hydrolase [Streptosporangiaceae bacterium]
MATKQSERLVDAAGVSIYTQLAGDGPPIVWVAGLGDDHTSWSQQVLDFTQENLCVTFDNRGIGRSSIPPGPYTTAAMAEDVHELIADLELGPVVAVGSSMGGAICQEWAIRHPEDMRGLVLTNTWGRSDGYLRTLFEHWIALAQDSGQRMLESLLLFSFGADYLAAHPDIAAEFLRSAPPNLEGFAAAATACREHDALDALASLTVPTLVVVGDADILTRPALGEEIVRRIPGAELARIPAGHMLFWERPAEFASAVRNFMRSKGL